MITATQAPWWARIPLLGNLGAPILRKEVLSLVRSPRWCIAQFLYLCIAAITVATFYVGESGRTPPEVFGTRLVTVFFCLQIFLLGLIFPGRGALSICSERGERSFDLLIVSDLHPAEIVWGKFLGVLGSAVYYLISTLPTLGICMFFGGYSPISLLADYFFLLLLVACIGSWSVFVSSLFKSNLFPIIGSFLFSIPFCMTAFGLYLTSSRDGRPGVLSLLDSISGSMLGPATWVGWGLFWLSGVFIFVCTNLVAAICVLSGPESNRGVTLRVILTILAFFALSSLYLAISGLVPVERLSVHELMAFFRLQLMFFMPLLAVSLLVLAGSRVLTPLRAVRRAALNPRRWLLLWLLVPGGVRGLLLAVILLLAFSFGIREGVLQILSQNFSAGSPDSHWGSAEWQRSALAQFWGAFNAWLFCYLGVAFFFAALGFRTWVNLLLSLCLAVLVILQSSYQLELFEQERRIARESMSIVTEPMILSPVVAMVSARPSDVDYLAKVESISRVGINAHWIVGLVFILAGILVMRFRGNPLLRLQRPGFEVLSVQGDLPSSGEGSGSREHLGQQGGGEDAVEGPNSGESKDGRG